jgi:hypothetical protein
MITDIRWDFPDIRKRKKYRIAYYNRVKQCTAVIRNSRGLFNNIRQIKQIHGVNQFIIMRSGTKFLLCSTYRPEWTDVDYWTRLNHVIGRGYQINQDIILTGDMNYDVFTSHNNKLIDTMNLLNLTNVIEKPTRVTDHSSTLLDPIIISDSILFSFIMS